MCSIIGVFNKENAASIVVKGLSRISHRGREDCIINTGNKISTSESVENIIIDQSILEQSNALGHCKNSFATSLPQSISETGCSFLSADCAIHNWKDISHNLSLDAKSDSDTILKLMKIKDIETDSKFIKTLDLLDGIYAFAYWKDDAVFICRDLLGVKPMWFTNKECFAFASEKKALISMGFNEEDIEELDPRTIIKYDINEKTTRTIKRDFFNILPEHILPRNEIIRQLAVLIKSAISKRIPDEKIGILFSGGIDSTVIAKICKDMNIPITCYTAAVSSHKMKQAEDLKYARKVANELDLPLKERIVKIDEVEGMIKKLVPLIEDSDVVKVGVGLTFYAACEIAKEDGVRVMFSGLGSEEIFAGYQRHEESKDINRECVSGLMHMYKRDLYRDDVIMASWGMQLRVPFLDKELVSYALKIPAEMKIVEDKKKVILRETAKLLGVPNEFAERPKRAAQYGSNFDKALSKVAKKAGCKFKSELINKLIEENKPKLGVLFSGGKDSCFALQTMQKKGYHISCLISMESKNPDSYMFHTPNIHMVDMQAKAMNIPLLKRLTEGEKEEELEDLELAIGEAEQIYRIEGIVTGALYSSYQRDRIELICKKLNLKVFSPLWHFDQKKEMHQVVKEGFKFMMCSIAADGLDKTWLGKNIGLAEIDTLGKLEKSIGFNVAGEGGEFETLVLDGPIFNQSIDITKHHIVEESKNTAKLIVEEAVLTNKEK